MTRRGVRGFDTARVICSSRFLLVIFASVASPWGLIVILVACVLEVGEIAFLRRWARRLDRRTKKTTGAEAMIGAPGRSCRIVPSDRDGPHQRRALAGALRRGCRRGREPSTFNPSTA
jgi:hypothetical protein